MKALQIPLIVLAAAAMAQTPASQTAVATSSVSGVVKDAVTGQPLRDYTVSTQVNATWVGNMILTNAKTREVSSTTDQQGRYKLSDLPAGEYRIQARNAQRFGSQTTKHIALAGHDIEGIDFNIMVDGTITGKVVDENKDPVPGMTVSLVSREYFLGSLGSFLQSGAQTNDRGEYTLERVQAGRPYLILAEKRERRLPPHSDVPLNPKLRKRVPMRTWYPNSPSPDGAIPMVLRSGERREGADIEVKKSQSYCIEGTLEGSSGPAALDFQIEPQQPSSGVSSTGGVFMATPGGTTGRDGAFRICDLYPGNYRLTAIQRSSDPNQQPPAYGLAAIAVLDRDIRGLKLSASPGLALDGEVAWDGVSPETPVTTRVSVYLEPLLRTHYMGENSSARADIPGAFSFSGLLIDDYMVRATVNGPGLYIKDVAYGGRSVQYEPLRLGSAMPGAGMRVVVGHDGATLTAQVGDKDGKPVPDARVLILPAVIGSEAELAARLVSGQTNQYGQYTSITLPPGKYYVAATGDSMDATPETIGKVWRARNRFKEVDLAPGASAQATLEPVKLE
jgi:protocatechuate 3,4-dioxygenase beta subunit